MAQMNLSTEQKQSHRHGLDPMLLWLWSRLAATAPIGPLAWEPPYATGSGPRKGKKTKQNKNKKLPSEFPSSITSAILFLGSPDRICG